MGFFADVGPMQIFVSIHLIPPDLKFYPDANPPNFSNEDQVIERGAMVRIKIMGLRMDVKDIVFPLKNNANGVCDWYDQRGLSWCVVGSVLVSGLRISCFALSAFLFGFVFLFISLYLCFFFELCRNQLYASCRLYVDRNNGSGKKLFGNGQKMVTVVIRHVFF